MVKEGALNAGWQQVTSPGSNATDIALTGNRIGQLHADGTARVKEGPYNSAWMTATGNIVQLALSADRIGVLRTDGSAMVKEGPLNAAWTTQRSGGVTQLTLG